MEMRPPSAAILRSCAGCAAFRPRPEGPCEVCESIQTILMGPGARSAVEEAYRRRVEARRGHGQAPSSPEQRKAEMDQLFGEAPK